MGTESSTHGELTGDLIADAIAKALAEGTPVWRAVGNVLDWFFEEKWIEIEYDPSVTPYYLNEVAPYPPTTKAWQIDPVTGKPVAIWYKNGWNALEWTQVWSSSSSRETSYPGPMTIIGTDYAGDPGDPRYALGTHSHPVALPGPSIPGTPAMDARLYPARIPDPRDHGMVACVYTSYYTCLPTLFSGWTEISPGVWEKNDPGALSSAMFDGVDLETSTPGHESSMIGKTVFAYQLGLSTDEQALMGPYVLEDIGQHWELIGGGWFPIYTKARMRRASGYTTGADFVQHMTFQLQTGNAYGTGFLSLDTAQPITLGTTPLAFTFTAGPTFAWTPTYKLLTGAQLTSEGADNTDDDFTWTAGTTAWAPNSFVTLVGTPGVTKLPAGKQTFQVERVGISTADLTGVTKLVARVILSGADGGSVILDNIILTDIVLTPNAPAGTVSFDYDLPTDVDWSSPTYRFVLLFGIDTTCTSPVTMTLRYSSASHGTWWGTTLQFPSTGGTNSHPDLLNRDLPDQHPRKALTPEQPYPVTITDDGVNGLMPAVPYGSFAVATPAGGMTLLGINITGWPAYGILSAFFAAGCQLFDNATIDHGAHPNSRGLRTYKSTFATYQNPNVKAGGYVRLMWWPSDGHGGDDLWHFIGGQLS